VSADSWKLAALFLALSLLLLYGLTTAGVVGPDEPRYASIGREMARSGDWITPRLWGEAWFEKPPLLYWMIGLANLAGLGPDLAPRLPVALLSLVFLLVYYRILRAEFGPRPAIIATAVLGTSAGWVAFSHVGVTDLPMSAALGVAMLLGLRWLSTGDARYLRVATVFFGIAVLAKGLVPLVLSLPLVWEGRRRWKSGVWVLPLLLFLVTATPWYLICGLRNGPQFLQDLFPGAPL
jgi:4-amino-4-deoxy-L-arabinose transferase-like glycosyltransferase